MDQPSFLERSNPRFQEILGRMNLSPEGGDLLG